MATKTPPQTPPAQHAEWEDHLVEQRDLDRGPPWIEKAEALSIIERTYNELVFRKEHYTHHQEDFDLTASIEGLKEIRGKIENIKQADWKRTDVTAESALDELREFFLVHNDLGEIFDKAYKKLYYWD